MKILDIYPNSFKGSNIEIQQAVAIIKNSSAVVYPTDTVYGLGVNALDVFAIEQVFEIKKRPKTKPLPIIVSSIEMAKRVMYIDSKVERILREIWPGPVTVVLHKKNILSNILTAGKNTIGVRIPNNRIALALVREFGSPITGTSANIFKSNECRNAQEVLKQFKDQFSKPDLILDAGQIEKGTRPSTIVDLTTSKLKILRVGPVTREQLGEILNYK